MRDLEIKCTFMSVLYTDHSPYNVTINSRKAKYNNKLYIEYIIYNKCMTETR